MTKTNTRSKTQTLTTALAVLGLTAAAARAHDTWLQTNTAVVRPGDAVYVDLMLGNHGNDHRDFKLAGKPSLDGAAVTVVGPDGQRFDLKPSLADAGYAPKEGFWEARFGPAKAGLYVVAQTSDAVATYAPERVVRSAKTYFLASTSLDRVPADVAGFDRVLGHPLELVPLASPVAPMGPGVPVRVRLLYKGKPLANERVSFVPSGTPLTGDFDPTYERRTDADGTATFEPKEANRFLIVAHHDEPGEKGQGYDRTRYAATLTVLVPGVCPCCGE